MQKVTFAFQISANVVVAQSRDTQIISTRCPVTCSTGYTGSRATNEIEHGGLSVCTVDNTLAKARGLSLRTGGQITFC